MTTTTEYIDKSLEAYIARFKQFKFDAASVTDAMTKIIGVWQNMRTPTVRTIDWEWIDGHKVFVSWVALDEPMAVVCRAYPLDHLAVKAPAVNTNDAYDRAMKGI